MKLLKQDKYDFWHYMRFPSILMCLIFLFSLGSYAQAKDTVETSSPSHATKIARHVSWIDVDGTPLRDVVIEFKSNNPYTAFVYGTSTVKVTIKKICDDGSTDTVYKRKFKNASLYIFSDGQVQVASPKFPRVVVFAKLDADGSKYYTGIIRERTGVY